LQEYFCYLKVAEDGGKGAYNELLDCFERVGIELRDEIDDYFKKYNK
jgi:type II restriction enzyme